MRFRRLAGVPVCLALLVLESCETAPLDFGNALVWTDDNERGDLSEWASAPGSGGTYVNSASAAVVASTNRAPSTDKVHSGSYSIKFTGMASNSVGPTENPAGAGAFKIAAFPPAAYYSAWYYLPITYRTITAWTILELGHPGDAGTAVTLIELRLQWLPSGDTTLVVFDRRAPESTAAFPGFPLTVPIGQWFQVEVFYQRSGDASGHLTVWLDGVVAYDLARPNDPSPLVYFSVCSLVNDLTPSNAELYADDVAVSLVRVTPHGTFRLP